MQALVEAYDPSTGKTGPHTVTAVTVNRDPATEHLVLDTGSLETTPNHPFYTADRGWVEAGALRLGERIRTATGTDATVVSFTIDAHPASMWDITVAGAHSFFVGSGEALVHNFCANPIRFTGDQQSLIDLANQARRTGLSPTDAQTMLDWADEYGLPTEGGYIHDGSHWIVGLPHIVIHNIHIVVIGLP